MKLASKTMTEDIKSHCILKITQDTKAQTTKLINDVLAIKKSSNGKGYVQF